MNDMGPSAGLNAAEGYDDHMDETSLDQSSDKSAQSQPPIHSPGIDQASSNKIAEVACWACRRRKKRCTGERPSCAPCTGRGVQCEYECEEGLTRVGSLRRRLDYATNRAEGLEFLFEQLRSRSDIEATYLLAIIRLGAEVEGLVEHLKRDPDILQSTSLNHGELMLSLIPPTSPEKR